MKVFFCLLLMIFSLGIKSQVLNIDRNIEQDTLVKKIRGSFIFSFSGDKQKKNIIDFSNTSELNFFVKKNRVFIFLGNSEFTFNGIQILENNGFFQFRFRDNDTRKIYPDLFTQY